MHYNRALQLCFPRGLSHSVIGRAAVGAALSCKHFRCCGPPQPKLPRTPCVRVLQTSSFCDAKHASWKLDNIRVGGHICKKSCVLHGRSVLHMRCPLNKYSSCGRCQGEHQQRSSIIVRIPTACDCPSDLAVISFRSRFRVFGYGIKLVRKLAIKWEHPYTLACG